MQFSHSIVSPVVCVIKHARFNITFEFSKLSAEESLHLLEFYDAQSSGLPLLQWGCGIDFTKFIGMF